MTWDILFIIGIIAYASSGAIIALQEKYDFFGVYILGLAESFGGGIIRNVLVGVPVKPIWQQGYLLYIALIAVTTIYFMPKNWIKSWNRWNDIFDAVGLSAFAIQGAIFAINLHLPIVGVILAAVSTGVGGGVIRDVLARRKPMVCHKEVYALWAVIVGLVMGYGWVEVSSPIQLISLFLVIMLLRFLSMHFNWHVRFRSLENNIGIQNFLRSWKREKGRETTI